MAFETVVAEVAVQLRVDTAEAKKEVSEATQQFAQRIKEAFTGTRLSFGADLINSLEGIGASAERAFKNFKLDPTFREELDQLTDVVQRFKAEFGEVDEFATLRTALQDVRSEIRSLKADFQGLESTEATARLNELLIEEQGILDRLGATPIGPEPASVTERAEQINKLNREIDGTRESLQRAFGENIPAEGFQALERMEQKVVELGGTIRQTPPAVDEIVAKIDAATERLRVLNAEAAKLNRTFGAGKPPVIQQRLGAIAEESKGIENEIAKLAGTAGPMQKFSQFFGNAIDTVSAKLAGFGVNIRDVGIILGSGFLSGGIALIARTALQMAAALTRAVTALGTFGISVDRLQAQINATFDDAAPQVEDFARRAASAFGVSERAALTFLGQLGQLFQSFGEGQAEAAAFAEDMFKVAEVLRATTVGGPADLATVLEDIREVVGGSTETLRKYNARAEEFDLRQVAISHHLKIGTGELTAQQKAYLGMLAAIDLAQGRIADYEETSNGATEAMSKFSASMDDLKSLIGQALAPLISVIAAGIGGFVKIVLTVARAFQSAAKAIGDFIKRTPLLEKAIGAIIFALKQTSRVLSPVLSGLRLLGIVSDDTSVSARDLAESEKKVEQAFRDSLEGKKATVEELLRIVDAHKQLNRAVEDFELNTARAELELARTREDVVNRVADAQRKIEDAYRERNENVADANKKLQDVERENAEAIIDARDAVADAQRDAFRSIRGAEEALSDERIAASRRLRDGEEKLLELRKKIAQQQFDALHRAARAAQMGDLLAEGEARLQESRIDKTQQLKLAERDLAEEISDSATKISRLERDLAETRIDAAERISDAERDLQRTIEDASRRAIEAKQALVKAQEEGSRKIQDALRALSEVEIENNRRLFDAAQRVEDAYRQGERSITDAKTALDRLNEEFGTTDDTLAQILDKIEKMKNTIESMENFPGGGGGSFRGHGASGEFAHGGFARRGKLALVGERGPELIVPNSNSTVISNARLIAMLRELLEQQGARPAHTWGGTVQVFEAVNPAATAHAVASRLMQGLNR